MQAPKTIYEATEGEGPYSLGQVLNLWTEDMKNGRYFTKRLVSGGINYGIDPDSVADIINNTWLNLLKNKAQSLDYSVKSPQSYVTKIFFNNCNLYGRRETRREDRYDYGLYPSKNDAIHGTKPISPEKEATKRKNIEDLEALFQYLSPKLRAVVVQKYWWDLSDIEISQNLGIPHATVRSRLNRARTALKGLYDTQQLVSSLRRRISSPYL